MYEVPIAPGVTVAPVMQPDAPRIFELVEQERPRLAEYFPWVDSTRTIADTRAFITGAMGEFGRGEGSACVIRVDGRIEGLSGCHDRGNGTKEVGYWIASGHEGRGIVTKVATWVIERCFTVLGASRIVIRAEPSNARSRAIPIRLGFTEDGTLRDSGLCDPPETLVYYSLRRDEWEAAPRAGT